MSTREPESPLVGIDAVLFDLDGVVTRTASLHESAWKRMFDEYLEERAARTGKAFDEFDRVADYRHYVDGRPRYEGVASFLGSRGIELARGAPADPPDRETVCGLGNRKNHYFREVLRERRVEVYESTVELIRRLRARGIRTAVVSSSKNTKEILVSAGLDGLFDAQVDGVEAERLGLAGKPEPATFLEAARRLGVSPDRAAVVEDALTGVEAGRRGDFGLVIGVDRAGQAEELAVHGAHLVVTDLAELLA